ncbi:DUF2993 domain-containing protein [Leptothermofonsia sichuanensis E412]|uniref:LmeA family phospholipid-binding protein n=1 Tax=Leptothermofonsia sichuanensis TaxID=2917832 RepID=UPI001CA74B61|nr:DUF2993 domain-containing protein [Leptothermofonsia sichuanensis]QZZ21810.1 DUF2993 domain-containing protein [Leptothermofonsia sichuanensis E412]
MESLVILLSGLITLISPVGMVSDRLAADVIRKQLAAVEHLQVRIDNAPSYQLVQGKADRIRIAGRGLFPLEGLRIEALDVETDPVQIDASRLRRRGRIRLLQPLQTGVRVVINQADMGQAFQSPAVVERLRKAGIGVLGRQQARQVQRYNLNHLQLEFLDDQRLRLQVQVQEKDDPTTLDISVETGIEIVAGRQLRLVKPVIELNGEPAPDSLVRAIADGVFERSDLRQLEKLGITARILRLKIDANQMEVAAFVQVAPESKPHLTAF